MRYAMFVRERERDRAHMVNFKISHDRLNCALMVLSGSAWVLAESHLNYCKIKFPYFLNQQRTAHTHTQKHTQTHTKYEDMHIHFTCCYSRRKSTGQVKLVPGRRMRLRRGWGLRRGPRVELVVRTAPALAPYIIISTPKRLIWVLANVSVSIWLLKSQKWSPVRPSASISASASAVGRPWHHKLQTDSPVCANNNVDSYSFSSLVSRCASKGFRFQFRFHGQCQRRATVPSRGESSWETESESESGWAPLKLDAICVQLGYANLPEPCQSTASPAATWLMFQNVLNS